MALLRPLLTDLSAGELDPSMAGRVDAPAYYKGCQEMTNWIPKSMGGAEKRPGFCYIGETRDSAAARLIPFQATASISLLLEFTAGYLRLWANDYLVQSGGSPLAIVSPYAVADLAAVKYCQFKDTLLLVHPSYAPWQLRFVSGTWSDGILSASFEYGTPSFIGNWLSWTAPTDTPWYMTDLWQKSAQWMTIGKVYAGRGTFNAKTISSAVRSSDTLTLTFSDSTTLALAETGEYSYQGTVEIDFRCITGSGEYPAACGVKNGRLFLGGTNNEPNVVFASKPLDYFNFTFFEDVEYEETNEVPYVADFSIAGTFASGATEITGLSTSDISKMKRGYHLSGTGIASGTKVKAVDTTGCKITIDTATSGSGSAASISVTAWASSEYPEYTYDTVVDQQVGPGSAMKLLLATEEAEFIQWICAGQDIIIGTASSEFALPGSATAVNASVALTGRLGSKNIQARNVAGSPLFIQRSGKTVRAWSASGDSPALNALAMHILREGVIGFDYQSDPETALWALVSDGTLYRAGLGSGVISWSRIETRTGDAFESLAVLGTDDGDALYVVVNRLVAGVHRRLIEKLAIQDNESYDDRLFLDSAVVRKSASTFTSVSGLSHLEGETVTYYAGQSESSMIRATAVVTGGQITVPASFVAYVGLLYMARLKTYRLETAETEGLKKKVPRIFFRLFRSGRFTIRYTDDDDRPVDELVPEGPIYTGAILKTRSSGWDTDQALILESQSPWPVGLLGIVPEIEVGQMTTGGQ
jgi:hypothetical protein